MKNCFIGVNSSFKNGVSVGNNVTVGMGSNVTKTFGDDLVLAGNPAYIFAHKCQCGKTNRILEKDYYTCTCGLEYNVSKTHVSKKS